MTNIIIYLIGFAGVGKYTIAQVISEHLSVKIIDNHYILNPIFNLIHQDGITPLPRSVWTQTARIRETIFETIATLSPTDWNFIFTNELINDSPDIKVYQDVLSIAKQRQAIFLPVRLLCETEELCYRIQFPQRRERMKDVNPDEARIKNEQYTVLETRHSNELTLNVTNLNALQAADIILKYLNSLEVNN